MAAATAAIRLMPVRGCCSVWVAELGGFVAAPEVLASVVEPRPLCVVASSAAPASPLLRAGLEAAAVAWQLEG
eukprot:8859820-Lingulodinium_polyedra.AAC.1